MIVCEFGIKNRTLMTLIKRIYTDKKVHAKHSKFKTLSSLRKSDIKYTKVEKNKP
jgi:hypothetical protein